MIQVEHHLSEIHAPANLRINDQINSFRNKCKSGGCHSPYHHFAFGQSPFPPPPSLVEALARNAKRHSYLPTAGMPELRETIAAYYRKTFAIGCEASQVVVSPGSKEMIAVVLATLSGPLIVPTPSWVSYLPQAKILKKEVMALRTSEQDGYRLTPDLLSHGVGHLSSSQKLLLLNHPNNPTGVVYSESELRDLAEVCRKEGIVVISDEIYALTTFEFESFTSMAVLYPEGTIVTGGLSKDRSCGGYRFGVGIFPGEPAALLQNVTKIAGSTYSCVAAPIQHAGIEGYSLSEGVEEYVRDCRAINSLAGRLISAELNSIDGVRSTIPAGAFYLYVDFNDQAEQFKSLDLPTCATFCEDLLHVEHTALLPGEALLLPRDDYSVRCSYVDFDGEKALAAWRRDKPENEADARAFAEEHFAVMLAGIRNIARYIQQIRTGRRPVHG